MYIALNYTPDVGWDDSLVPSAREDERRQFLALLPSVLVVPQDSRYEPGDVLMFDVADVEVELYVRHFARCVDVSADGTGNGYICRGYLVLGTWPPRRRS